MGCCCSKPKEVKTSTTPTPLVNYCSRCNQEVDLDKYYYKFGGIYQCFKCGQEQNEEVFQKSLED